MGQIKLAPGNKNKNEKQNVILNFLHLMILDYSAFEKEMFIMLRCNFVQNDHHHPLYKVQAWWIMFRKTLCNSATEIMGQSLVVCILSMSLGCTLSLSEWPGGKNRTVISLEIGVGTSPYWLFYLHGIVVDSSERTIRSVASHSVLLKVFIRKFWSQINCKFFVQL